MTRFYKAGFWVVAALAFYSGGSIVYAREIWPPMVRAQELANQRDEARRAQEWERIRQETERLEQRAKEIELENEKVKATLGLTAAIKDANLTLRESQVELTKYQEFLAAETRRKATEGRVRP